MINSIKYLYQRYIFKNIIFPYCSLLIILVGLVWLIQILKFFELINKGVGVIELFMTSFLIIPSIIYIVSPLIAVVTTLNIYNKMHNSRELIALYSLGISSRQILKPFILFMTIISLISYLITFLLLPQSFLLLKEKINNFKNNYISANFVQEKLFNSITKHMTIYVEKKKSANHFEGIVIIDKSDKSPLLYFAQECRVELLESRPHITLNNGYHQSVDSRGNCHNIRFNKMQVSLIPKYDFDEKSQLIIKNLYEYYIKDLIYPDKEYNEKDKLKLISEGHMRLTWPFYNLVLSVICFEILVKAPYSRKTSYKNYIIALFISILLCIIHFGLQKMSSLHKSCYILMYLFPFSIISVSLFHRKK